MSEETTEAVAETKDTEITEAPEQEEMTPFMKRFLALEHQSYIMYLQLNSLTAMLVNGQVVDKDKLIASMDEMDSEIKQITDEIDKEMAETA